MCTGCLSHHATVNKPEGDKTAAKIHMQHHCAQSNVRMIRYRQKFINPSLPQERTCTISLSMQMREDSPLRVCVLMLIGHGREQRPDAVGEIAHFEYWNQTVITAWRRCHHFTSCRGRKGGTRGMIEEKERSTIVLRRQDEKMF